MQSLPLWQDLSLISKLHCSTVSFIPMGISATESGKGMRRDPESTCAYYLCLSGRRWQGGFKLLNFGRLGIGSLLTFHEILISAWHNCPQCCAKKEKRVSLLFTLVPLLLCSHESWSFEQPKVFAAQQLRHVKERRRTRNWYGPQWLRKIYVTFEGL